MLKKRNLQFLLSKEEFIELTKGNCYYCNKEPMQVSKVRSPKGYYVYNGIDRKDNSIGYLKDNCVSCCHDCNLMKMDVHHDDFINKCKIISGRF